MNKDIKFDDINIEEYEKINVSLDDIKKRKMKKRLVGIIRRRNSRKFLIAVIAMILILNTTNISSISAIAKNIPIFNKIYEQLGFSEKYLPKSTYIGQSIEEKGVRITIDNIVGTKHMIMLSIKVEKIDETLLSEEERRLPITAEFGERKDIGSGGGSKRIDDKTEMMVLSLSSIEEFPSKGEIKLNMYSLNGGKFNEGFTLNVDFTESYNEVLEKNFSMGQKTEGINIKKLEVTTLGALVEVEHYEGIGPKNFILKIDDKFFPQTGIGVGSREKTYLSFQEIAYEDIENAKTIAVIELNKNESVSSEESESLSEEEIDKIKRDYEIEENILKERMNSFPKGEKENIQYIKEMTFNNGNKVEIYNIERGNGIVRVYLKGQDKKQVLEVAIEMMSCDLNGSNYEFENKTIENDDGYIVEFNDRNKEGFKIQFRPYDVYLNGSSIGKEILLGSY